MKILNTQTNFKGKYIIKGSKLDSFVTQSRIQKEFNDKNDNLETYKLKFGNEYFTIYATQNDAILLEKAKENNALTKKFQSAKGSLKDKLIAGICFAFSSVSINVLEALDVICAMNENKFNYNTGTKRGINLNSDISLFSSEMQEIQTSKRIYFEFHKNGVLKSEVFENGEEHFYYSNGTLKKRKKPDGTEVFYNRAGQIIKELLPNGVKILYRYNENSATKREIYPNGTIKISKQNI